MDQALGLLEGTVAKLESDSLARRDGFQGGAVGGCVGQTRASTNNAPSWSPDQPYPTTEEAVLSLPEDSCRRACCGLALNEMCGASRG